MEALDIIMKTLDKRFLDRLAPARRGPKGHGFYKIIRLLVYAVLVEIFSTRKLLKKLKKYINIWKRLGFISCPSKRSIDRWKRKFYNIIQEIVRRMGNRYLRISNPKWSILDSTPLVDENDPDATLGYNSQGPFIGFKLHASCDEHEVPLRAVFTQGHIHDSQKADELIVPTPNTGGDAGYDSNKIKNMVKELGSKPYFVHNPRKQGKEKKRRTPRILKKVRVVIEQFNGFVKSQVMKHSWTTMKGYVLKATFSLISVLAIQCLAVYNLKEWGYPSIRIMEARI